MSNYEKRSRIAQIIEFLDIGGVYPQFTVRGTNQMYKTYRGGMISILLYLASIVYSTYIMELWRVGEILPKTETQTIVMEYQEYKFKNNPIDFYFLNKNESSLNPFDPLRKIIVPIVQFIHFTNFSRHEILRSELTYTKQGFYGPLHINDSNLTQSIPNYKMQDLTLIHNQKKVRAEQSKEQEEMQVLVSFIKCDAKFISKQEKCASKFDIDEFFRQPLNQIHLTVNLRQYQKKQLQFQEQPKTYYFLLDPVSVGYTQVVLRTKMTNVRSGLVFQKEDSETYVSEAQVTMQTVSPQFLQQDVSLGGMEFFFLFLIRLDSIQDQETVSYVTLGELLAQIGSIINVLFSIKPILHYLNRRELQTQLLTHIGTLTYGAQIINPLDVVDRTNIFNIYATLLQISSDFSMTRDKVQSDATNQLKFPQKSNLNFEMPQIWLGRESFSESMRQDQQSDSPQLLTAHKSKDPPLSIKKGSKVNQKSGEMPQVRLTSTKSSNLHVNDAEFLYKSFEV